MTVSRLPDLWARAILLPTALLLVSSSWSFRKATPLLVAQAQGGEVSLPYDEESFYGQWGIDFDMQAPTLTFDPYGEDSQTVFGFRYSYTGTVVPEEKYLEVSILEHECWLPLSRPDALFVPDTEIDANNKKLHFDVVVDEDQISRSSYYTDNGDDTADIKFCVRVDYRTAAQIVNWKEVNVSLRITYNMIAGFSISGILTNPPPDDDRERTEAPTAAPTAAPFNIIFIDNHTPDETPPDDSGGDDDISSDSQQTLPPSASEDEEGIVLSEDEEGIFDDPRTWIYVGGGTLAGGAIFCCICAIVIVRRRKEEDAGVVPKTNVVTVQIAPTEQCDCHDNIVCDACKAGDPHSRDIEGGDLSHTASETASGETSSILGRSISIPSASSSDHRSETSPSTKSTSTTKSSKTKPIQKSSVENSKESSEKTSARSSQVKS